MCHFVDQLGLGDPVSIFKDSVDEPVVGLDVGRQLDLRALFPFVRWRRKLFPLIGPVFDLDLHLHLAANRRRLSSPKGENPAKTKLALTIKRRPGAQQTKIASGEMNAGPIY